MTLSLNTAKLVRFGFAALAPKLAWAVRKHMYKLPRKLDNECFLLALHSGGCYLLPQEVQKCNQIVNPPTNHHSNQEMLFGLSPYTAKDKETIIQNTPGRNELVALTIEECPFPITLQVILKCIERGQKILFSGPYLLLVPAGENRTAI